ncbi:MAG: dethiobiotin synthase [Bacteroidales bacterium]
MKKGVYFVTGIDTNVGKTAATGFLAKEMMQKGLSVITQKMVQTGCEAPSEDIVEHRRLMGIPLQEVDLNGDSCPIIFSYPCSPHLASEIDNKTIDLDVIELATQRLAQQYDIVLLEGAGGVMVPITKEYLTIDYMQKHHYPVIVVTSGKLGSINHTLLTLEAIRQRGLEVSMLIYNLYPAADPKIEQSTLEYFRDYLQRHYPEAELKLLDKI